MLKKLFASGFPALLCVVLISGCAPKQPEMEVPTPLAYRTISPADALAMTDENVVYLDVRTQEEYDDGHIPGAVLLPDIDIADKAESMLTDKEQTILVYCKTGVRSKAATEDLMAMGYADVYDLGGIDAWTGEIVGNEDYPSYYNYFGGDLPPDIVAPIDFTVRKQINGLLPEFIFYLKGEIVKSYWDWDVEGIGPIYYIRNQEAHIEKITITTAEEVFIQEISALDTQTFLKEEYADDHMYGLAFDDWNSDGYIDISLWVSEGGSIRNKPTRYWIWDSATGGFIENIELKDMSDYSTIWVDNETKQVGSYTRADVSEYGNTYYKYINGSFNKVKFEHVIIEPIEGETDKWVYHITENSLVDGEWVTNEYYKEITE